jgi:hypothetical protein
VVALGANTFGEVLSVPLLFEAVVNHGSVGGLPMFETVGGLVATVLVEGDLLVEPGDGGGDMAIPALLSVDLPLGRGQDVAVACRRRRSVSMAGGGLNRKAVAAVTRRVVPCRRAADSPLDEGADRPYCRAASG